MYQLSKEQMNMNTTNNVKTNNWIWYKDEDFKDGLVDNLVAAVSVPSSSPEARYHYAALFNDIFIIQSSVVDLPPSYDDIASKENASVDENNVSTIKHVKKKVKRWNDEEHRLFLEGLVIYGKGQWKNISKYIGSRSSSQVSSHAQKYFLRQSDDATKKRKRMSIHDDNPRA